MPFVAAAQPAPPELTQPVNDFGKVIDPESATKMDELIRSLQRASGDVVVVATIDTFMPYGDIREYAVKMFENGGRGIGQKGKDNGALLLVARDERKLRIEVGYGLEGRLTDAQSSLIINQVMVPAFKRGDYAKGIEDGVVAILQVLGGEPMAASAEPEPVLQDFFRLAAIAQDAENHAIQHPAVTVVQVGDRAHVTRDNAFNQNDVYATAFGTLDSRPPGFQSAAL